MSQPNRKPAVTDWRRVKREAAQDTPIAHTAADGPYDPNDPAAVASYWQQASIKRGPGAWADQGVSFATAQRKGLALVAA